jgi:hypothetical protein
MTKHEFQNNYTKMTGFSWDQLENYLEVVPCTCGNRKCPGWQMITLPTSLPPLAMDRRARVQSLPRMMQEDHRGRRNLIGAQM